MNQLTVAEVLHATDWPLLAKQKRALIEAEGSDLLSGLLGWIDALQDAAENEGYPVIFLTENEDARN